MRQIIYLAALPKQPISCLISNNKMKHSGLAMFALPLVLWVSPGFAQVSPQPATAPISPSTSATPPNAPSDNGGTLTEANQPQSSVAESSESSATPPKPDAASGPTSPPQSGAPSTPRSQPTTTSGGITLVDGTHIPGRVIDEKPGAYAIVERPDGKREAVEWSRIQSIDNRPPAPLPTPTQGSLIPDNFTPQNVQKLGQTGKAFSETAAGLVAPKDGNALIGSITQAQDLLEQVGLKRGSPNGFAVGYAMFMLPLCFEMNRGTIGRVDGTGGFGALCTYVIAPLSVGMLVAAPFISDDTPEMTGPSVHHVDASVYALDYSKKSALTGSFAREPSGGFLGNNLGYDLAYTYIHPSLGIIGYGAGTLQQTSISSTRYLEVSSSFLKADLQTGIDVIRLLSGGSPGSYWSQHTAYVRAGPSYFHNWILSRDAEPGAGAAIDNPLNNSVPLVTGFGYEIAAEADFRFPYSLGGVHFKLERGTYPYLSFPELNPRDGAFVALIGFDDLRAGDTYTWQRLKLELELPVGFSRKGGFYLGGQLASYENNFGSGVDNRGLSLDYRFRFQ